MRKGLTRLLLTHLALAQCTVHAQSLLEFYRQALETNPSVRSGSIGIEQARAQEDLANSRLLPQLSVSASRTWIDDREQGKASRNYQGQRTDFQARQTLLDLASYFKLQAARYSVSQSERQNEAARMGLGGDVVDRYLTVLQAGDEITHLLAEKELVDNQVKRLRFMHERQLAKVTDLYEIEAYQQGLLTREIEARNARAVALERLRETTGIAARDLAPLVRESFPAVSGTEEQWVGDAGRNNPNLAALRDMIEAAQRMIDSGRAEHVPQLALTASRISADQGFDNRLAPPYVVGTIGLQFSIPIYEGGRVVATVRDASARHELARERHEGARREVERDTRTAYLGTVAGYARIGSTNEEVRSLEKLVDAQQKSYALGVSTLIDVLIAQRRLFRSRSDQSRARYDFIRAHTSLRVLAGVLVPRDIEEIDGWMAGSRR